ncbi:MAG TPA: HYR domain-containing protein, partial [Herpetosiphonaceae bacterium]|nr:HYR domain-containing protein [Herpetosiphonaceae bacterium]
DAVDPSPSLECAPPSGSVFPLGPTTVACTASDSSGNTATAAFTVTVTPAQAPDTTPPVISVPADLSVTASDASGAAVSYAATATDAVDPSPSLECAPPSGSIFPVGTTTVTCTAKDASGNTASASFAVIVVRSYRLYLPLVGR